MKQTVLGQARQALKPIRHSGQKVNLQHRVMPWGPQKGFFFKGDILCKFLGSLFYLGALAQKVNIL